MTRRISCLFLSWLIVGSLGSATAQPASPPTLIVIVVVDQMRADYVERFQHQWTSALRRLVDKGAWFRQAAYPSVEKNGEAFGIDLIGFPGDLAPAIDLERYRMFRRAG